MVIKLANLSQGFLPLAPHLLPSGVWEQRGFSEGSPKPPIKICFPRQIGDCTPKEGEQSRAVLSSVSTINYSGVLWPGWEEMEQYRSRGEYPSQNRETAVCLGGSYCSFTIIFFCKVLNCKKLFFFCSVNRPLYFEFAYTGTMVEVCLQIKKTKTFGIILVIRKFWIRQKDWRIEFRRVVSIAKYSWKVLFNLMPTLPVH